MTNIVLGMDYNSIKYMDPLINSIKNNVKNYRIYLICNKTINVNWAYKVQVLEDDKLNVDNPYTRITKHTYYRLFIDLLFPELDKCIYLDYDTLVIDDISDILNDNNFILKAYFGNNIYANAGVLIFNFNTECKQLLQLCREKIGILRDDQIIINTVFKDKIEPISWEYNCMDKNIKKGSKIIHFVGKQKPWEISSNFILWFKFKNNDGC